LHGLFAQVVVDPEDLGFVKALGECVVQRSRGFQVIPDWFLNDHPRPFPVMHQSRLLEAWRDVANQRRRRGQVKKALGFGIPLFVEFRALGT
jgi:hypothetical protein